MAAVRQSVFISLGRYSPACRQHGWTGLVPAVVAGSSLAGQRRHSSGDTVKFLKSLEDVHMKRGKGGRSSFSGIVCTIFGATGFMGRYICNKLGKEGTQMILPYRGDFYDARHLKLTADLGQTLFIPFHLCNEEVIAKAVRYSHVVVNLVGSDFETRNFNFEKVHIDGAARVARICKRMGVERLIHVSALNSDREHEGVFIKGGSKFLSSKGAGEIAVLEEFPEATIIRPSDIYGSEDRFLRYFGTAWRFEGQMYAFHNGGRGTFKQPVFVSDVAQAISDIILKNLPTQGRIYQAVGPRRYEMRELAMWFLRILRRTEHHGSTTLVDMKWEIVPRLKARFNELMPWGPINWQTTDKLERETVSDEVAPDLPTLEDLGVTLTKMEDQVPWELRPFRQHNYYDDVPGEFKDPALPRYVQM